MLTHDKKFSTVVEPLPRERSAIAKSVQNHQVKTVEFKNTTLVPQPGSGRRRGGGNESDYEEIGPPIGRISQRASPSANGSYPASTTGEPNNNFKNEMNSNSTCDLCGTATAIVRCRQCTDQVFCLACDDMYHRHPKRSVHQRKAIDEQVSSSRPPLPPKADQSGPIAPPRKSVRKGSIPDSPIGRTSSSQSSFRTNGTNGLNGTSKSSTLPRKMASSNTTPPASIMAGRPLPPPPPVSHEQPSSGQFSIPDGRSTLTRTQSMTHGTAPPALPAKNIHSSNMSLQPKGSFNSPMSPQNFNPQAQSNSNNMHTLNGNMGLDRPGSIASQPPLHLNYPPKPPQLLNSLQQSNPYPNNNSINRGGPNQRTDIPFQNGNQNRANSIGFQSNPNPTSNNMISNRNPSSSMAFQQDMFGNANRVPQPQMHPQMRSNNDQFQGVPDRMSNQNPYPNGINGFSQQSHPGMQRPMMPNNISTNGANDWNPYHEEMQFPTPSVQSGFDGFQEERRVRKELPSRYRNRLSKLNKSSSLHDLAHGFATDGNRFSNDGVSWEDSKWQTTQSTMNQPTVTMAELLQQRTPNVKRSGSTKSLHQDSWQANGMPNPHLWPNRMPVNSRVPGAHDPRFNPLMNPMMNQGPAAFHRSMHELSMGGNPDLQPGFLNPFQLPATIRSTSPSNNSQKSSTSRSKKSSRSTHKRSSKSSKHRSSQDLSNSRPSSRNASRNSGRKSSGRKASSRQGFHHSNKKKSSSRHHRRSETSEEEEVSESPTETTGEFFTGESDNDFVSLSSGSNPRKPPKKSWMCEHCTYMNNPGVGVCVVCSRTSAKSRGELPLTPPTARPQSSHGDKHRPTKNKTSRNSSRYASSEDESDEEEDHNSSFRHQSVGGRSPKLGKSPKLSTKKRSKMRGHQKTPLPKSPVTSRKVSKEEEEEKQKIVDDLEQDAHDTYYSLRIENMNRAARDVSNTRHYESSSETSSINNPLRKPNFDAPAPAKGILKKSSSNPQLTKLELEERGGVAAQSEFGMITKTLQRHLAPKGPGKVIDIKKYLDQTRHSPSVASNGVDNGDIWHNEKSNWIRAVGDERDRYSPPKSSILNEPEAEYLSDVETNPGGRMYRAVSGLSLGEHEGLAEHDSNKQAQRRSSEAGKRNFRSKRFSRNLERDPIARRSNSLQVNRSRLPNDDIPESMQTWVDTQKGTIRTKQRSHLNSESSSEEAPLHYTAKIEAASKGPGGIGSYKAKQEFGSADGQPPVSGNPDSGYVSNISSGGGYPKMQLPTQEPMESFTMSVDRGFLGRAPGDRDPGQYRSMDDLAVQKTTGLELVRLLRDAEQAGFTAEDIQVSLNHCGEANPVMWLNENWDNMMETVMTLASNVGHEKDENTIGTLSKAEAKEALRTHKGNIWAAVTECVEQRQKKYDELCSKGNFTREDIVTVLTAHQGNVEAAFQELNKAQLKPFLMRIWGQPEPGEVESGQDINALNVETSNETKVNLPPQKSATSFSDDSDGSETLWSCSVVVQEKPYDVIEFNSTTNATEVEQSRSDQQQKLDIKRKKPINMIKDFNDGDSIQASADDKTNFESVKVESKSTRLVNGVVEDSEATNVSISARSFNGNNEEKVYNSNAKTTIQKKVIEYVEESEEDVDEEEEEEEPTNPANDDDGSPKATNFDFDRRVRRLLAEGKITSYDKGELAVKLKDMEFEEDEALLAADNCENVYSATKFLHQECELCASRMNVKEIFSMLSCEHKCCRDCASRHFTIIITDRSISELVCPFCQKPEKLAEDDELAADYFAKLDILLKSLVDQPTHDLFQRKLRDRTLMKDPNFKWCYKCPFGFIADPKNKKLVCPDCRAMSCAKCLVPWEPQHEGVSCEDFAAWKEANDPDNQADGLKRHLDEHGMECPACKFKYTLSRGGCMHFTCTQCKHEFCIGCYKPFKMGVKCGKGAGCARMGLHAHHPRNCLFYLRDKEPADLQKLLRTNKIEYKTDPTEASNTRCPVQVQKETKDGMEDAICGELSPKGYAGYCKVHYTEYLCTLVFRHSIEPVSILEIGELKQVFTRANHFMPKQRPGEYEFQYKKRLSQLILHEIPLDSA